jgi:hypothetical protein
MSPKHSGRGTGVVFLGHLLMLEKSPGSRTASAGEESNKTVSAYNVER